MTLKLWMKKGRKWIDLKKEKRSKKNKEKAEGVKEVRRDPIRAFLPRRNQRVLVKIPSIATNPSHGPSSPASLRSSASSRGGRESTRYDSFYGRTQCARNCPSAVTLTSVSTFTIQIQIYFIEAFV